MKLIAIITHQTFTDSEGVGWEEPPKVKEFEPETPIEEIWAWYEEKRKLGGGILDIQKLE